MCGIVGFVGKDESAGLKALHALRFLEYRGYDSWGIATRDKTLHIAKAVGKISAVPEREIRLLPGKMAIGHTRWATHGGVTEKNAHPQTNRSGTIAVVHNGIIENHEEIREFLRQQTHISHEERYVSQTDTEVVAHLMEYFLAAKNDPEDAFVATTLKLKGRFTIVVMIQESEKIFAARDGSPLVVGIGTDGHSLASDYVALSSYATDIHNVGEREYVVMEADTYIIRSLDTRVRATSKAEKIQLHNVHTSKDGYPHFMLKEMMEEKSTVDAALAQDDVVLERVRILLHGKTLFLTGCGTAGKMAILGQYLFSKIAGMAAQAFVSSEYELYISRMKKDAVLLVVSQSGETADTLECIKAAQKQGVTVIAILNAQGSTMERLSTHTLFIHSGIERAVASTKAALGQMTVLILLAFLVTKKLPDAKKMLRHAQDEIRHWMNKDLSGEMHRISRLFLKDEHVYIVGRGMHGIIAEEAAIKIQEVAYLHAQGFAGGELKHGPLALIAPGTKCIAFLPNDETRHDMEGTISELKARGAWILGMSLMNHKDFDEWIQVPDLGVATPLASIIPLQLLAYHLSVLRGNDPDMPRNLAKSVTVK
jgi:glucosamine--fructose-6-phosphate aminotransferase (isomerizing)